MAWWTNLADRWFGAPNKPTQSTAPPPDAFSAMYPVFETTTPQYPAVTPWHLITTGYSRNELVFACTEKRAVAVSEAPMLVYDSNQRKTRKAIENHPARVLLSRPNPFLSEVEFWQATEIYTLTAGFAAWEIEYNNGGEPIALWPMRPQYCSFRSQNGQPIAFVRYSPPGMPHIDVPIERVLLFMEFNPLRPQQMPLSRSAVAMRVTHSDNAATDFIANFFERGAVISGILRTQTNLNDAEAARLRARWRELHGGQENWGDIAVLGSGAEYQSIQMNFRDMDFTNVDGRDEARICSVFGVPPILINAKVGLSASTYSNYEQARKAFYEETVAPRWAWFESVIDTQLLPRFRAPVRFYPGFDTTDVKALQEDRTARWQRAVGAANAQLVTRDEARLEMGLDAIDDGEVFIGAPTIPLGDAPVIGGEDAPDGAVPVAGAEVQQLALNGAQITSLVDVITAVSRGELAAASAQEIIRVSFPAIPPESISRMVDAAAATKPPPMHNMDMPGMDMPEQPAQPEQEDDDEAEPLEPPEDAQAEADDSEDGEMPEAEDEQPEPEQERKPRKSEPDIVTVDVSDPSVTVVYAIDNGGETTVVDERGILSEWRREAVAAVKAGQPIPTRDGHDAINADLAECKTASDVRAVFERHWPAQPAQKAPPPPDQPDRMRAETKMQAALTAYFAGLIDRLRSEVG